MEIFHDSNGVKYNGDSISLSLDPKIAHDGINFTSHAHMDHLPSARSSGTVLCTYETVEIAKIRNRDIQNNIQHYDGVEMINSGHILGGRGPLFDDVFYTGDICTRNRPGITGAKIPKCSTLIMECTFGMPQFRFPPIDEVVEKANKVISEMTHGVFQSY